MIFPRKALLVYIVGVAFSAAIVASDRLDRKQEPETVDLEAVEELFKDIKPTGDGRRLYAYDAYCDNYYDGSKKGGKKSGAYSYSYNSKKGSKKDRHRRDEEVSNLSRHGSEE